MPRSTATRSALGSLLTVAASVAWWGCADDALPARAHEHEAGPPIVFEPGYYIAENQPLQLLQDGDPIGLVLALQGGQVMYVGVRARQIPAGKAKLSTRLIDPTTGEVVVSDAREIDLVPSVEDPSAVEPDVTSRSQFSHLLSCPNFGTRSIIDEDWQLEVTLGEVDDPTRDAVVTVTVRPFCSQGSETLRKLCECECGPSYQPAKCGAIG